MDAVYDLSLSLHRSVQDIVDIRIHTSSSCGLLIHVRLWPYSVFLYQRRLFVPSFCFGTRPVKPAKLSAPICYEDRLPVLLFCSIGHVLVRCDLCYDAVGVLKKRFPFLSPKQDRTFRGGDHRTHESARDT